MEIAYETLRMCRFEIETAGNGKEAVELFRSRPAGHFDAILMDIFMPVMDGPAAARAIRELDWEDAGTVPIIALSANVFEEDREKSEASGMSAHLAKPVNMDAMCRLPRRVLAGSGSPA